MNEDSQSSTPASTMSTTGALVSDYRILSVKSSINGIGWNEQYRERLEELVNIIHATATHTYSLSKFIFLCALQDDDNFYIAAYINKEFFSEIWLFLMHYHRGRVGEAIDRRWPELKYAQQSSLVEGWKMYTAYINNIGAHFGNHFRRAINTLLQIRQRKAYLIRQKQEERVDNEAISNKNNIYYDAKANPCEHIMTFYQLARLFETLGLPILDYFPLRRTWIPIYATVDTDLNAQQHGEITDHYVTIDSGRRDILYCVHENSTADAPRTNRYSKSCQDKMEKTKKYRRIGEAVKPQVRNAEDTAFEEVYHQGYQWDASRI
ncbi:hypothetical protein G6F66_008950 [Rhizopus arrhizus]|nr:hypothetical protein G6F66_008950 [Rhizopus arrhizus]